MVSSTHAQKRADQRGISQDAIDFTLAWGKCYHRTGVTIYVLRRKDITRSKRKDLLVLSWEGTTVVADGNAILTVYQNKDVSHIRRKPKRDLKAAPPGRRRRKRRPWDP
jgi:hypothetical protein